MSAPSFDSRAGYILNTLRMSLVNSDAICTCNELEDVITGLVGGNTVERVDEFLPVVGGMELCNPVGDEIVSVYEER